MSENIEKYTPPHFIFAPKIEANIKKLETEMDTIWFILVLVFIPIMNMVVSSVMIFTTVNPKDAILPCFAFLLSALVTCFGFCKVYFLYFLRQLVDKPVDTQVEDI